MFKQFISITLLVSLSHSPAVKQQTLDCSTSSIYQGEELHPGIDLQSFSSEFDVSGDLTPALSAQLDDALKRALEKIDAPGVTAAVGIPNQGTWSASVGLASTEPSRALGENSVFWWASTGKLFTASVILQLIAEEKLTLNQTIDPWFPRYPQAQTITIENLLTHTGGVFSFQQDLPFRERTGYTPPDELIAISARHGADFCPGEYWSYSNTGYVMLAQIIEKIEGRPFSEVVTDRIIIPQGLTQTQALDPEEFPANLAIGHVDRLPIANFRPSLPFGAGNIVASSEDMVVFLAALLSGNVYPRHLLRDSLAQLYPMFDNGTYYGQGIMLYDIHQGGNSVRWVGHGGGSPSVKAIAAYDLENEIFVAVAVNADSSAEAVALSLVKTVQQDSNRTEDQ